MATKATCRKCGQSKPQTEFARDVRYKKKTVYKTVCKTCDKSGHNKSERPREIGLPWHKDPAVLQRLEIVSTLMSQGLRRPHQIQKAMVSSYDYAYTWDMAKDDIARVEELNLMATVGDIAQKRANSIERLYHAVMRVWENYNKVSSSEVSRKDQMELRHKFLALYEKLEARIIDLEGTRMPTRIVVDQMPVPVEVQQAILILEQSGVSAYDVYEEIWQGLIEAANAQKAKIIDVGDSGSS